MARQRLSHKNGQTINCAKGLTFKFNNRTVDAFEGDTIASALYGAGIRIFSRSFKYHRPRGLLCVAGNCPNCLMEVDGVPNVRVCTTQATQGLIVCHQNAWPSLDHDVMSIMDKLDYFLPVGFYYKILIRPKFMWRLAEPVIRRLAGLGKVHSETKSRKTYQHQTKHVDLLVIGAGLAGTSAALEAANLGAHVTLVDNEQSIGGHLRYHAQQMENPLEGTTLTGCEIAKRLAKAVDSQPNIETINEATVSGFYADNMIVYSQRNVLTKVRAKQVIVATGCHEVPTVYQNNDLPGTLLGTAVRRLLHLYNIKPGNKALIVTNNDQGYTVANDLANVDVQVVALVDSRSSLASDIASAQHLRQLDIPIIPSATIIQAHGTKHVRGATITNLDKRGNPVNEKKRIDCDLIVLSTGFEANNALLYQQGANLSYDPTLDENIPFDLPPTIQAAGEITGIHDVNINVLQGKLAGMEAAVKLGGVVHQDALEKIEEHRKHLHESVNAYKNRLQLPCISALPEIAKKKFVCICEDVTEKDLDQAIYEGFADVQILKRYSTVTMGPCQGKMCSKIYLNIAAKKTNQSIADFGTTTSRPPVQPIPLGLLAGPSHLPVKMSTLEHKQRSMGAQMMNLGQWRRPFAYTSPREEVEAVRQRVGIIDVSSLGKLEALGKDVPALLDKIYTHKFSSLRIGRIRYGIMCTDAGAIMDDGTVSRMAEDHYYITTTTGNVELIEQWIKWWISGTNMCAHISDVTSAFCSINVAGPKARDTLKKLTSVDLSPDAFRYMRSAQGNVAGIPTRLLRIGFVGETGWEIHFPTEYGEYMWDRLIDAGMEFGITPFGMEAQRILRLEKKHIIVGQDTDSVSNPLESNMEWAVKFDKEDFIGKRALQEIKQRGLRNKLVGFLMMDSTVPEEGAPVIADSKPIGRVTSSRLSFTLGRGCGLAWVPLDRSEEGEEITILVGGKAVVAQVAEAPFYDPEGTRLRE